jgi:tetratricopeptide (TPR) repeat protein
VPYDSALKNFEIALGHFRKQHYEKAAIFFKKAAASSVREVAERSRMHLRLCEQKNRQPKAPKTAEDFYLRGVAALNGREAEQAIQYFNQSDKMVPNKEHVQYALAAAHGLQGDLDAALIHLQKAIDLRPANRVQARFDEDFQALAADPRFGRLVGLRSS